MTKPVHVYQVFINAPTDIVWNAIVDGDMTVQYFYGTRIESTWEPGAAVTYAYPDGTKASEGEVISIDAGSRLEMTFLPLWDPELTAEGAAREVWSVEDAGGVTKLTVETYDIPVDGKIHADFTGGFPLIVSGLKTLLETGQPLQMHGAAGN
jgi:uncharacterized protein YndB with AHSA1/START domain